MILVFLDLTSKPFASASSLDACLDNPGVVILVLLESLVAVFAIVLTFVAERPSTRSIYPRVPPIARAGMLYFLSFKCIALIKYLFMNPNLSNFNTSKKIYELSTDLPPLKEGYPISAKVIADSISPQGKRITTLELEFPRYILAEFNTHRALSRNASSSRAIPTAKASSAALENMVFPVRFGKNKKGMQADQENLTGLELEEARLLWENLAKMTASVCQRLSELGLHKQWASRPLEWFSTIRVVTTFTEIDNFFWLRDHSEAQDEICYLAQAMKIAMNESVPRLRKEGEWHLPYVSDIEFNELGVVDALKVSASRCARISYKTHLGVTSTLKDDVELFKKLTHNMDLQDNPFHASPTEHQALPIVLMPTMYIDVKDTTSNFKGWIQHRQFIEVGLITH